MQAARGTALSGTGESAAQPAGEPSATAPLPPAADDPAGTTARAHEPVRPRRLGLFVVVAALALAADVLTKILIVANVEPGVPKRELGGAVYLLLIRNSGAAFSVGTSATILFSAIALIIVVVIVRVAPRLRSAGWAIALALVLGGALGNLADRLFRAPGWGRGHVVDWISVFASDGHVWPIFNLADSAIDCGGVLAALMALLGVGLDGRRGAGRAGRSRHDVRR